MQKLMTMACTVAMLVTSGVTTVQAGTIGSFSLSSLGPVSGNNLNVTAATSFTFTTLVAVDAGATGGYFNGIPLTNLGTKTVDSVSGFSFSNAVLGTFTASHTTFIVGLNSIEVDVVGSYTGGTYGGVTTPNPITASAVFNFQQSSPGSAINGSGVFNIPSAKPVPEPSSIGLALVGLGALIPLARRRRETV